MTSADLSSGDMLRELHYALAETDAETPSSELRDRVMAAALLARRPGQSAHPAERISGVEVFRQAVDRMDHLLGEFGPEEWSRPALRGLDVQGLIGHLIGVEDEFIASLERPAGSPDGSDHIASTQPTALAQGERSTDRTHQDWSKRTSQALALLDRRDDLTVPVTWFGITLPLDQLLVIRAFEMWIHEEDIRRANGRLLRAPEPAALARMADLAVGLLPAGMANIGFTRPNLMVRLVLTGPGGGTWDVVLDGPVSLPPPPPAPSGTHPPAAARLVVDTAAFCRVVANRDDLAGSGAIIDGDLSVAAELCRGAATLALD